MKFQVLHEDDKQFHVQHADGRKFRVAKAGLGKATVDKIRAMAPPVKFAEGGEAQAPDASLNVPYDIPLNVPATMIGSGPNAEDQARRQVRSDQFANINAGRAMFGFDPVSDPTAGPYPSMTPVSPDPVASYAQQPSMVLAPAATALPAPSAPGLSADPAASAEPGQMPEPTAPAAVASGADMQMGAMHDMASAKSAEARSIGAIEDQRIKSAQDAYDAQNKQLATIDKDNEGLRTAVADSKIDPNRIWNNASTGNKILASISLILGGMGGRGNGNAAMDVLNKAIEQDVNSQKFDVQKKETLYGMNLKKYSDVRAAYTASLIQAGTIAQAMMAKVAAQSGSADAAARAKLGIGQIQAGIDQRRVELAQMLTRGQAQTGGVPEGGSVDQQMLMTDPKYSEKRVTVDGTAYQAADKESATKVRDFETLAGPAMRLVQQLDKLGPAAAIPGTESYNLGQALRGQLSTKMAAMQGVQIGGKRITEAEIEHQQDTIKDPKAWSQLLHGGIRNQQFFRGLEDEGQSVRANNLVGYRGINSIHGRSEGFK